MSQQSYKNQQQVEALIKVRQDKLNIFEIPSNRRTTVDGKKKITVVKQKNVNWVTEHPPINSDLPHTGR